MSKIFLFIAALLMLSAFSILASETDGNVSKKEEFDHRNGMALANPKDSLKQDSNDSYSSMGKIRDEEDADEPNDDMEDKPSHRFSEDHYSDMKDMGDTSYNDDDDDDDY